MCVCVCISIDYKDCRQSINRLIPAINKKINHAKKRLYDCKEMYR